MKHERQDDYYFKKKNNMLDYSNNAQRILGNDFLTKNSTFGMENKRMDQN